MHPVLLGSYFIPQYPFLYSSTKKFTVGSTTLPLPEISTDAPRVCSPNLGSQWQSRKNPPQFFSVNGRPSSSQTTLSTACFGNSSKTKFSFSFAPISKVEPGRGATILTGESSKYSGL